MPKDKGKIYKRHLAYVLQKPTVFKILGGSTPVRKMRLADKVLEEWVNSKKQGQQVTTYLPNLCNMPKDPNSAGLFDELSVLQKTSTKIMIWSNTVMQMVTIA